MVGAELDSRAGGRIRVTARLGDVTPTDDDAPMRWSRESESEDGQVLDFDVSPGDAPGFDVAAATVPTDQRRHVPARAEGDVTPVDEPAAPAAEPARCGSCGGALPVRTGPGRRRRYCGDACRSRAARHRNPAPIRCELRASWLPCDQPAVCVVREPDEDHPSGWSPHGLKVAACEDCAELVEAFAVRQPG